MVEVALVALVLLGFAAIGFVIGRWFAVLLAAVVPMLQARAIPFGPRWRPDSYYGEFSDFFQIAAILFFCAVTASGVLTRKLVRRRTIARPTRLGL
jgi:hypothetical protein